jgi:hypothetical protein
LPPKVELGEIILERGTIQHHLFMKKDKLVCGTIILNVVDSLLHHVACAKTTKDAWDNLCITLERIHVGNRL